MTQRDAWIIRRLLCSRSENGEHEDVVGRYRGLAEKLAALPIEARQVAWDEFLAVQPNAEELTAALVDAAPDGPMPEAADEDSDDGWGPILVVSMPEAEPFPLGVLPIPARALAEAAADSISCPVDFPAVAILAAASGLVGRSVVLRIKPGHTVSASVYAALVGSPSAGKSPALNAALRPLWNIGHALHERWRSDRDAWEATKQDERGPEPLHRRIVSTDATTEALGPILAKNPRGLTVAPDEMTKWVMSMDQYRGGKGGDRPFFLSAWGSEAIYIDRAKNMQEPIAVPHPFLTVIGGMTPDMLTSLSEGKGREDGFMARMLFTFPEPIKRRYSEAGIPDKVADDWNAVANALFAREPRVDERGKPTPHVVGFIPEAKRVWKSRMEAHYAEQEAHDFPPSMEGPWGKFDAYAARLALILKLLDLAADPTVDPQAVSDIGTRHVENAWRLVAYFKSHALRVYAAMEGKNLNHGDDVNALVRWIKRGGFETFSMRDIDRNFDRFRKNPEARDEALAWMKKRNLIRDHVVPEAPTRGGRKPSPSFDINPGLRTSARF